jgi:hypothetical protein
MLHYFCRTRYVGTTVLSSTDSSSFHALLSHTPYLEVSILLSLLNLIKRLRKIAKGDYLLCMSVRPSACNNSLHNEGFS